MSLDLNNSNASAFSSPYLNFDPSILRPSGTSQFIIPEGQTEQRGKMEMSFMKIGGAVSAGYFLGSINGLYLGSKEAKSVAAPIRKTMLINFVGKQGSKSAQIFGALALLFSLNDTIVSNMRGVDDQFNVVPSAALTGLVYSASSGLKTMAKSSLIGAGLSLAYLAVTNKDLVFNQMPAMTTLKSSTY